MKKLVVVIVLFTIILGACNKKQETGNAKGTKGVSSTSKQDVTSDYPKKNINIIVAYKAGGGTDVGARILMKEALSEFSEPLVIINKPGAGGQLGFTEIVKAKPDGYTIGFINLPNYISISLTRKTEFNKDSIAPIINYVYDPGVVVVRNEDRWKTLEEFIADIKANPDTYTVSNNGTGASNHIGALQLSKKADIVLKHIPFGGSSDMLAALRGSHVDITMAKVSEIANLVKAGELRVLASFTDERLATFPDLPTLKEKGYAVVFGSARGLAAPKGTPAEIIKLLHDKFKKVMELPSHIEAAKTANLPTYYMGTEEYQQFINKQEKDLKEALKLLDI